MAVIEIKTDVDLDLSKYSMSLNDSGYVAFFKDGQCMLLHGMKIQHNPKPPQKLNSELTSILF